MATQLKLEAKVKHTFHGPNVHLKVVAKCPVNNHDMGFFISYPNGKFCVKSWFADVKMYKQGYYVFLFSKDHEDGTVPFSKQKHSCKAQDISSISLFPEKSPDFLIIDDLPFKHQILTTVDTAHNSFDLVVGKPTPPPIFVASDSMKLTAKQIQDQGKYDPQQQGWKVGGSFYSLSFVKALAIAEKLPNKSFFSPYV